MLWYKNTIHLYFILFYSHFIRKCSSYKCLENRFTLNVLGIQRPIGPPPELFQNMSQSPVFYFTIVAANRNCFTIMIKKTKLHAPSQHYQPPGPYVDMHVGIEPASPNEIMLLSNITEFHFFTSFPRWVYATLLSNIIAVWRT